LTKKQHHSFFNFFRVVLSSLKGKSHPSEEMKEAMMPFFDPEPQ